jgi:hypothetical protein
VSNKDGELSHICDMSGKDEWGFDLHGCWDVEHSTVCGMTVLRGRASCRGYSTLFSLLVMMVQGRLRFIVADVLIR